MSVGSSTRQVSETLEKNDEVLFQQKEDVKLLQNEIETKTVRHHTLDDTRTRNKRMIRKTYETIECYDIEFVKQCTDWTSKLASIVLMVTLWIIEFTTCLVTSFLLPPFSIIALVTFEAFRGRQHSVLQLLPWNGDTLKAEIHFSRKDFANWDTFCSCALKTVIAVSIISLFGYVPGIFLSLQLWTNYFLVRSKIWWRMLSRSYK